MPNHRTGYVAQYKDGRWFARVTVTDERGRRRNIVRRAKDRFEAQETLRTLLGQIEESGSKAIDAARLTFHDLANYYQSHYLQPAEYVDGRKISGLRDVQRPLGCLNNFRAYFGKKKHGRSLTVKFTPTAPFGCGRRHTTTDPAPSRTGTGKLPSSGAS
jgi:hypothetical protein